MNKTQAALYPPRSARKKEEKISPLNLRDLRGALISGLFNWKFPDNQDCLF